MTDTRASPVRDDELIAEVARRNSGLGPTRLARDERVEEDAVRRRWRRWLRFGGRNDWRLLRRRMRAENLRPSAVYQPRRVDCDSSWCATLGRIMAVARDMAREEGAACAALPPGGVDEPFSELFASCLVVARERLAARVSAVPAELLGPRALDNLEVALLARLAEIVGGCLLALFDTRRPRVSPLALTDAAGEAPRERYRAFVAEQLGDGYREIAERWPVAVRLMATLSEQWAEACGAFLGDLAADFPDIRAVFFPDAAPGPVVALDSTTSDSHQGGRSVLSLTFANGARLVYKPRPMEPEAAFSDALRWLNGQFGRASAAHRVARVLPRADHGWMEWIAAAPMAEGEEAGYHWRLGSLMGLYRALNGIDMHSENMVAAGDQPVFVDVECLLHPSDDPFLDVPDAAVDDDLPGQLLRMGILPAYVPADAGARYVNVGAIGKEPCERETDQLVFRRVNGDWMFRDWQPGISAMGHHPRTAAGWVESLAYRRDIADGYRETLDVVLNARDWLLDSPDSPLAGLRRTRGRHLARTTWNYALLMRGACTTDAMSDGVAFDLSFEPLYRYLADLPAAYRHVAEAERSDLRNMDVPRFAFAADRRALFDAKGVALGECYARTPYEIMAADLRALTRQRVAGEVAVLECALAEYMPGGGFSGGWSGHILAQCVERDGCAPLWLGLSGGRGGVGTHPMQPGLYGGVAGVALALGAAGFSTGNAALCAATSASLVGLLAVRGDAECPARASMGYDHGAAGVLYALAKSARLCADPGLESRAVDLALACATGTRLARMLDEDSSGDFLNGAAGLSLVLLNLFSARPEAADLLWAARACGDHLLRRARRERGGLAWGDGLSGFSHGGTGFAVAFAALYRATGHGPYRDAAFDALAHEASLFVPEWGNWRDMRGAGGVAVASVRRQGRSWCHGAPGIALGRAAMFHLLEGDLSDGERQRLTNDLETALDTTRRALKRDEGSQLDELCCGIAGRIDILLECGRLLDRPDLTRFARRHAKNLRARWADPASGVEPRFWFSGKGLAGCDVSLFKGMSGQLYLNARLADPEGVPCVLLPL